MTSTTPNYGLGRRKTARAQVVLLEDTSIKTVNDTPFQDYFPTVAMQQAAQVALVLTSQQDKWGYKVRVSGGGKHSQAGAMKLAIARALIGIDDAFRKQLKDSGVLTRDPRMKERKKAGLKRARRAPQFSKR